MSAAEFRSGRDIQGTEEQRSPLPSTQQRLLASTLACRLADGRWTSEEVLRKIQNYLPKKLQSNAAPLANGLISRFPQKFAPDADRLVDVLLETPAMLELYRHCTKLGSWPTHSLKPTRMQPIPPFDRLNVPALHTIAELADWLMLTPELLDTYVDKNSWREAHPLPGVNNYFYRLSPKSGGGLRLIEAPKPRAKAFQRLILRRILVQVPSHPDSFGFVPGRDCKGAAKRHAGEDGVIGFDLNNFFSIVQYGRVYALFRHLGYPASVAHSLSGLCTVITPSRIRTRLPFDQRQTLMEPHLPQGAPSSPALANLVTYRLDRRLAGLARSIGANYTRYADDLTFSGDREARQALLTAVPQIIEEEGFKLNATKTRVMTRHQRQVVTGIVVNEALNIPRKEYDRLKTVIHQKKWKDDPPALARLRGRIGWVAQLNRRKGEKLFSLLERARVETQPTVGSS